MKPKKEMLCIPIDGEVMKKTLATLIDLPMHKDKRTAKRDVFQLVRLEKPPTREN